MSPAAQSPGNCPSEQYWGFSPGRMHIFQNGSLVIHDVAPEDSGRYRCRVTNKVGSAEAFAQVLVQGEQ